MKTNTLAFFSIVLLLTFFGACNLNMNWPGVCESHMNSYYFCETSSDADICEGSNIGTHVYSSETCKDLGYSEKGGSSVSWKDGDVYFISPDGATTPGANGYFAGGGSGGSGGNGGSGVNCDLANYNGPEFDIQADSQCKTAYLYDCAGNQDGVKAACTLYYEWESTWQGPGSYPKCPYCH